MKTITMTTVAAAARRTMITRTIGEGVAVEMRTMNTKAMIEAGGGGMMMTMTGHDGAKFYHRADFSRSHAPPWERSFLTLRVVGLTANKPLRFFCP